MESRLQQNSNMTQRETRHEANASLEPEPSSVTTDEIPGLAEEIRAALATGLVYTRLAAQRLVDREDGTAQHGSLRRSWVGKLRVGRSWVDCGWTVN